MEKKNLIQVGPRVDREIWQKIKIQAAIENKTVTQILNEAMLVYLEKIQEQNLQEQNHK